MRPSFVLIYMSIKYVEPPSGLFERIVNRIHKEQRLLTIRRRIAIFSVGLSGSSVVFIPVFKMLSAELAESGFIQFLSLLFSDFSIVARYWQSFVLTLLETLPAISLIVFLTIIFVFLESLKFLIKNTKSLRLNDMAI